MRWFVEVSRVGENSSDEKYCVEAKQWQAALQEARRLRGDSGPLSKFSIELLDDGFRAVDPKHKLRFLVAKAPQDAELSNESSGVHHLNGQAASVVPPAVVAPRPSVVPLVTPSVAPPVVVAPAPVVAAPAPSVAPPVVVAPAPSAAPPVVVAPAPVVVAPAPSAAPPVVVAPATVELHAEPYAGVPSSALSPAAPASAVHVTAMPAVESAQPALSPATTKSLASAAPPRPDGSARPAAAKSPAGIKVPVDAIPAAPALPQGLGPPVAPSPTLTQPSAAIDMPPPSSVLRKREEEPTAESPITYREVAYVVDPGVSRGSVEALLWASFRDITRGLADREGQKFVQLAIFDHKFDKRPVRAPLGTLAWKDWRGNPVLTFPLFDGTQPARASVPAPSIKPVAVVQISSSLPPASPVPVAVAAPEPVAALSEPAPPPTVIAGAGPSLQPAAPLVVAVTPPSLEAPPAPSDSQAAAIPLTREKMPSQPSAARASKPRMAALRRRAGEDLIGELFETMHDLHFFNGVADGAEFMLAAVDSIVPCDGVLIHVFDINTRQFVVVRAKGPGSIQVLLQRTPDSDPFFNAVMRRPGSVAIHDVASDPRVLGPRWEALGVKPQRALCGPVRQGGRYLGLLEVVNPLGDAPFHQTEQNAIDYVCEQFAEFLANRPIVLEADVILRR